MLDPQCDPLSNKHTYKKLLVQSKGWRWEEDGLWESIVCHKHSQKHTQSQNIYSSVHTGAQIKILTHSFTLIQAFTHIRLHSHKYSYARLHKVTHMNTQKHSHAHSWVESVHKACLLHSHCEPQRWDAIPLVHHGVPGTQHNAQSRTRCLHFSNGKIESAQHCFP